MLVGSIGMIWQTITTASAATEHLAKLLGEQLAPPMAVELLSDLGGGKTTFARGLARGLGYTGSVTSPTFTLRQTYICRGGIKLEHFDFYRLNQAGIMADQLAEAQQDN